MLFFIATMMISELFVVFDCYDDAQRAMCVVFDCYDDD